MSDSLEIAMARAFLMHETTIGRPAAKLSPIAIETWLDANYEGGWDQFVIDISAK